MVKIKVILDIICIHFLRFSESSKVKTKITMRKVKKRGQNLNPRLKSKKN